MRSDFQRILVLNHAGIGDAIMQLPLLRALRQALPASRLACTVNSSTRQVLDMAGIDIQTFFWPRSLRRNIPEAVRTLVSVRNYKATIFIVPPVGVSLRKVSWFARFTGAPYRIAGTLNVIDPSQRLRWFERSAFTHLLSANNKDLHVVESGLSFLPVLDLPVSTSWPRMVPDRKECEAAHQRLLSETGLDLLMDRTVAVHIGCEKLLEAKIWPLAHMAAALTSICRKLDMRCLVMWGPADRTLLAEFLRARPCGGTVVPVPWGCTLAETAALVGMCQLAVSNDSGIAHLAAAVGTKLLTVFGPTNYRITSPFGPGCGVVFKKVSCGPCYAGPNFYCCPYERQCLTEIPVNAVVTAALRVFNGELPLEEEEITPGVFFTASPFVRIAAASRQADSVFHRSTRLTDHSSAINWRPLL